MEKQSLAQEVLGIHQPHGGPIAAAHAYGLIFGAPFGVYEQSSLLRGPGEFGSVDHGHYIAVGSIAALTHTDRIKGSDPLVDWPAYSAMMQRYGQKAEGNATALLVGAYSPLSTRAFACQASTLYGANRTVAVDLNVDHNKARHVELVQGNALQLPFRSESIDFVVTNHLMHMLVDPHLPSRRPIRVIRQLVSEIARVLTPGGQLLMRERPPGIRNGQPHEVLMEKTGEFEDRITRALGGCSLAHIKSQQGGVFVTNAYLYDSGRNFQEYPQGVAYALDIYARKPRHRTFAL